jgi:glyoxylase I family protein
VTAPPLHHLLVAVLDLERARQFYREIVGLPEIARPNFPFAGAWFAFGNGLELHLVMSAEATMRGQKDIDAYDVHFAVRVKSYTQTVEFLRAKGFREDAPANDIQRMILRPDSIPGYPQIYVLDPDRNIIEFNCENLT